MALNTLKKEVDKYIRLASKYYRKDDEKLAIKYFKKALKLDPSNTDALYTLGYIFHEENKLKETKLYYKKLMALKPKAFIPYLNLGRTYLEHGDIGEAKALCKEGLRLKPKNYEINCLLADIYIEEGKVKKAMALYEALTKAHPRKATAFFELACLYDNQKKYAISDTYFQQAIKLDPKDNEMKLVFVISLMSQQKWEKALPLLKKLTKADPKNDENFLLYAKSLEELNRLTEAKIFYRKAAKLGSPQAAYQLKALAGKKLVTLPKSDARSIFNDYAENFEHDLIKVLKYHVPKLLHDEIQSRYGKNKVFNQLLDLGAGTGLVGETFKNDAKKLVGVDISQKMLKKAKEKGCYAQLYNDDIIHFLQNSRQKFDLILSSDVLIYLGDLANLFKELKRVMLRNTVFAFTTEHDDSSGFKLQTSGRYSHSLQYIKSLAEENGLKMIKHKTINLRKEYHQWVKGKIYILENRYR